MSARVHILLLFVFCQTLALKAQMPVETPDAILFQAPDTVCVNQTVTINPGAIGGSNFSWSFCSANAGEPPGSTSLGNPSGVINNPGYITMVRDTTECFTFMTNLADSSVVRTYFGNSFSNPPVSSISLGNINLLSSKLRGIQVLKEAGNWTGFIVDGSTLYRFNFNGNTLLGQPQIINDIPFPSVGASSGMIIRFVDGQYVGFVTDSQQDKLVRLRFPLGLSSPPQVDTLGNLGALSGPTGMSMLSWNGSCYLFVANEGNSTITRVDFGFSFLGTPSGTNLGNIGGLLDHCTGIEITGDCEAANGFVTNQTSGPNGLVQLQFPYGLEGTPTAVSLGNQGGLDEPFGFSELIRVADTIIGLIPNRGDNTLTKLTFPPCTAASRPGDPKVIPDPFYYLQPGTWNIHLTYLDPFGAPRGQCQPIVVRPELQVSLGADRTICQGDIALLDPGSGYTAYNWSTGDTSESIQVSASGSYWVHVSNTWGCEAADTVAVAVMNSIEVTVDTLLCYGGSYWAQGAWQTTQGTYRDSTFTIAGCDSITITDLAFKAEIPVNLGRDTLICPGEQILLHATLPGAAYQWQDGSSDSTYLLTDPGIYWVEVTFDDCAVTDSLTVNNCPAKLWFPTAFTPNGDGLNDTFRPVGISIYKFRMIIFDRWGQQLFETDLMDQGWDGNWKGSECQTDSYSFIAFYETVEAPGQTEKARGTFVLVR
ncbi:MAG: gliding motility-associated C-terminal domain-containing protein [Bacteroidales bacterium]|nr:gliding motility-associated C-terminal domain-containing protein [Bacteroidales bacterium]